ncbi:MAG TPA: hypothetical protein ENN22_11245 [bacterium]|nr:hypothetical protein [bacterium]
MKNISIFSLTVIFLLLITTINLIAQSDLGINGYIKTDNRLRYDSKEFTWNENRLNLKFEGAPSDKYHFFSEVRLRGFGFPNVTQSSDLQRQEKDKVYRWGLEFREAYLDLYQFGLENLDLRIGRQIISWGTADKLNPTSNISPDDLEDIFNFGEQLGTNALKASYYLGDVTLTGVFVPVFTPATLPLGDFASAFAPPMDLPPGVLPRNFSDSIILPENKLTESSQFAFKAATNLLGYDVSLSYFKGRDDLPLVDKVTITPVDTLGTIDIDTELIYPKMQVIGADFAGSIGSVGFWGEGALFIPDKVEMSTFMQTQMGLLPQATSIALDDKPYFRYVIGGDYTFKNGLYLNAQFLHGFIHERGEENLNDYIAFRFEKKFFNDELKIVPFGGAIAINDWNNIDNDYGFLGNPEITYYPSDNVELILGAYWLEGKGTNMFSQIKKNDELYVKVKVSF